MSKSRVLACAFDELRSRFVLLNRHFARISFDMCAVEHESFSYAVYLHAFAFRYSDLG